MEREEVAAARGTMGTARGASLGLGNPGWSFDRACPVPAC